MYVSGLSTGTVRSLLLDTVSYSWVVNVTSLVRISRTVRTSDNIGGGE